MVKLRMERIFTNLTSGLRNKRVRKNFIWVEYPFGVQHFLDGSHQAHLSKQILCLDILYKETAESRGGSREENTKQVTLHLIST